LIVLDTHVWLWSVDKPEKLSRAAASAIRRANRIGVSTASVFELAQLVERRWLALDVPVRTWVQEALRVAGVESVPVDTGIALDAAQLRIAGDPFDRIIYATAVARGAMLVTRDEQLRELGAEQTIW
jgi:PIN domain nuclease of toxin-antitoxin system